MTRITENEFTYEFTNIRVKRAHGTASSPYSNMLERFMNDSKKTCIVTFNDPQKAIAASRTLRGYASRHDLPLKVYLKDEGKVYVVKKERR